jgi:hypothetical protein
MHYTTAIRSSMKNVWQFLHCFFCGIWSFLRSLVEEPIQCTICPLSYHQHSSIDTIPNSKRFVKLPAQRSTGHGITYHGLQVGHGGSSCIVPCDVRASSVCRSRSRPAAAGITYHSTLDVGNNNYLRGLDVPRANKPYYGVDFPSTTLTGRFINGYNSIADYIGNSYELGCLVSLLDRFVCMIE